MTASPDFKVLKRSQPLESVSSSTSISTLDFGSWCHRWEIRCWFRWTNLTRMRVSSVSHQNGGKSKKILEVFAKTIGDWWNKSFCYRCFHDLKIRKHKIVGPICRSICFFQWIYVMAQDYGDGLSFIVLSFSHQLPCESWRQKLINTSVLMQFTMFCSRLITMAMCGF